MDYFTLGRSGLRVSPICLGAMTFGEEWGWGATLEESHALLDCFLAAGGNFIDTANGYTHGHSEVIIGDYFAARPGLRDRTVIATKFFTGLYPGDPNGGGTGRKSIIDQLDHSLRRLRTDYIDLYWMHAWDRFTPIDETMRVLDDQVRAGKIRYIGFSDTPAWKVAQAQVGAVLRGWTPLVALQIEYSLRERTVEAELIPAAKELGLGVVPWGPLGGGILTGKYRRDGAETSGRYAGADGAVTERDFLIVDALEQIAADTQTTVAAVALAWLRRRDGVTSTIVGARDTSQLRANLASLEVCLSDERRRQLDQVSAVDAPFPQRLLPQLSNFAYAGTTINGYPSVLAENIPKTDAERY